MNTNTYNQHVDLMKTQLQSQSAYKDIPENSHLYVQGQTLCALLVLCNVVTCSQVPVSHII